jgi:hypothetical protein
MGRRLLETVEEYAKEKALDEIWIGVMVKTRALSSSTESSVSSLSQKNLSP